jgi:hypothetical protein
MSNRLRKEREQLATDELLAILEENPVGLTTSQMSGTPKFHGVHTLTKVQIARLLRKTGKLTERTEGQGIRTYTIWRKK